MKYLVDTSALVRIVRRQVDPGWYDQVRRGLIAICEPVLAETLTIADPTTYRPIEEQLQSAYPWVVVPDDAWDTVREVRKRLADISAHQGVSVADYLVAATAMRHRLVVLHQDRDFETVARVAPQLRQERITRAG
jgi:predicted nucleic acid-binding protein